MASLCIRRAISTLCHTHYRQIFPKVKCIQSQQWVSCVGCMNQRLVPERWKLSLCYSHVLSTSAGTNTLRNQTVISSGTTPDTLIYTHNQSKLCCRVLKNYVFNLVITYYKICDTGVVSAQEPFTVCLTQSHKQLSVEEPNRRPHTQTHNSKAVQLYLAHR